MSNKVRIYLQSYSTDPQETLITLKKNYIHIFKKGTIHIDKCIFITFKVVDCVI